jgi:hypothetical protein
MFSIRRRAASLRWRNAMAVAVLSMIPARAASALGPASFVDSAPTRGAFRLVAGGVAAPIVVDSQDYAGAQRAAAICGRRLPRDRRSADSGPRRLRAADLVIVGW